MQAYLQSNHAKCVYINRCGFVVSVYVDRCWLQRRRRRRRRRVSVTGFVIGRRLLIRINPSFGRNVMYIFQIFTYIYTCFNMIIYNIGRYASDFN